MKIATQTSAELTHVTKLFENIRGTCVSAAAAAGGKALMDWAAPK